MKIRTNESSNTFLFYVVLNLCYADICYCHSFSITPVHLKKDYIIQVNNILQVILLFGFKHYHMFV